MQQINGRDAALAVLNDSAFVVPPVPPASAGVAWLRATVGRFSTGATHERRRALSIAILDAIALKSLRAGGPVHPVAVLARAMGLDEPVVDLVRDVAQAYQPGTGDESRADAAVTRLVAVFGGVFNEPTAARIGVLVQACQPTMALIERARHRPVDEVLRDDPPVPVTKRQALVKTTVGDVTVEAGEVVDVPVNVLFLPGQHTVAALADLGARRISTGSLLFRAALAACVDTAVAVRDSLAVRPDLPSYAQINAWSSAG